MSALSVSGRGEQVEEFLRGRALLRREQFGQLSRAVIRSEGGDGPQAASALGLDVESVSLQHLIAALTNQATVTRQPTTSSDHLGQRRHLVHRLGAGRGVRRGRVPRDPPRCALMAGEG
ncbi:MAG: hypothetical protein H0T54_03310 [Geodermatophilaceae bacterium]|nr:hypothetical protein [Geodermatophilaceae bacterium]